MKDDLEVIFGHCAGFDGVDTAEKFHGYIRKCQVETTMPFNDYWPDGLPVGNATLPITPLKWTAILAAWRVCGVAAGAAAERRPRRVRASMAVSCALVAKAVAWGAIVVPLLIGVVAAGGLWALSLDPAARPGAASDRARVRPAHGAQVPLPATALHPLCHRGAGTVRRSVARALRRIPRGGEAGRRVADPAARRSARPGRGVGAMIRLDLADIQGNIHRPYGRFGFPHTRHFFFNIADTVGRATVCAGRPAAHHHRRALGKGRSAGWHQLRASSRPSP